VDTYGKITMFIVTKSYDMGKIKRMDQVRMILSSYLSCGSIKGTAKRMLVSKNTVRYYVRLARECGSSLPELMKVSEKEFDALFSAKQNRVVPVMHWLCPL